MKYRSVFSLLKEELAPCTTAWAAERTGIEESLIIEAANLLAAAPVKA